MPAYTVSVPVYGGLKPDKPAAVPAPRSQYEAAKSRSEDERHWLWATSDSAADANDPAVRHVLRKRSLYEFRNGGFLNGLVKQLANDLIGTGPRLQLQADPAKREQARQFERQFARWCRETGLAAKLRLAEKTRVVKGEAFLLALTNPRSPNPVKLDFAVIDPARVAAPSFDPDPDAVDGIRFDAAGNPVSYTVHDRPRNELTSIADPQAYETVPARRVLHWFRADEPGQYRGVPETSPTLLVGAQVRRFGAAVLGAAETAASIAGVMKTNGPAVGDAGEDAPSIETMDEVDLPRKGLLTLPEGWDAQAFKSEQPTTTYPDFTSFKLNECSRPHLAPKNLITGDSSGFNFASGKLDHLPYQQAVWINRDELRWRCIDAVLTLYVEEAYLLGLIPDGLLPFDVWEWDWYWDGFSSINPEKDAAAAEKRLALGLTTLQELNAEEGKDYEDTLTQRAKEMALMRQLETEYGVSFSPSNPAMEPDPAPDGGDPAETGVPADA